MILSLAFCISFIWSCISLNRFLVTLNAWDLLYIHISSTEHLYKICTLIFGSCTERATSEQGEVETLTMNFRTRTSDVKSSWSRSNWYFSIYNGLIWQPLLTYVIFLLVFVCQLVWYELDNLLVRLSHRSCYGSLSGNYLPLLERHIPMNTDNRKVSAFSNLSTLLKLSTSTIRYPFCPAMGIIDIL